MVNDIPLFSGIISGMVLAFCGLVAILQDFNFAKVYATYEGIIVILSIFWANKFHVIRHVNSLLPTKMTH
ncbi:MAG: hypothetical protein EBQ94_11355 [Flavobacteriales bacterium]|nr:hypothetical protein [Crocinitomicaceae bacterium]NBX80953.1 hypothetical protein [Flavobacteriales bacterium]